MSQVEYTGVCPFYARETGMTREHHCGTGWLEKVWLCTAKMSLTNYHTAKFMYVFARPVLLAGSVPGTPGGTRHSKVNKVDFPE